MRRHRWVLLACVWDRGIYGVQRAHYRVGDWHVEVAQVLDGVKVSQALANRLKSYRYATHVHVLKFARGFLITSGRADVFGHIPLFG